MNEFWVVGGGRRPFCCSHWLPACETRSVEVGSQSLPAVLEHASHDPAMLVATSAKLQHGVVDVMRGPLVVAVGAQVLVGHVENAQVTSAHRQRLLEPLTTLTNTQTTVAIQILVV